MSGSASQPLSIEHRRLQQRQVSHGDSRRGSFGRHARELGAVRTSTRPLLANARDGGDRARRVVPIWRLNAEPPAYRSISIR